MKLRIRGNSIRLRLLRGEVAQLGATGAISETVNFGASSLIYTLRAAGAANQTSAQFIGNEMIITVPNAQARDWVESNNIGIEAEQTISPHETLTILVEKDFVCLDRPGDQDNADAYPHPSINC